MGDHHELTGGDSKDEDLTHTVPYHKPAARAHDAPAHSRSRVLDLAADFLHSLAWRKKQQVMQPLGCVERS